MMIWWKQNFALCQIIEWKDCETEQGCIDQKWAQVGSIELNRSCSPLTLNHCRYFHSQKYTWDSISPLREQDSRYKGNWPKIFVQVSRERKPLSTQNKYVTHQEELLPCPSIKHELHSAVRWMCVEKHSLQVASGSLLQFQLIKLRQCDQPWKTAVSKWQWNLWNFRHLLPCPTWSWLLQCCRLLRCKQTSNAPWLDVDSTDGYSLICDNARAWTSRPWACISCIPINLAIVSVLTFEQVHAYN